MTEALITVFTKDNLDRLRKTLPQYSNLDQSVVLIDDSVKSDAVAKSSDLCEQHSIHYHGRAQQESLLSNIPAQGASRYISKLGTEGWTLGKTRNYALVLGAATNAKKLIMIDDDIMLTGTIDIDKTVAGLDLFDHVGAHIGGMPDQSVVGYLALSAGFHTDCYVSGSFLGITMSKVEHYFLNKYNEDWIWLLLETNGAKPPQLGSVHQLNYDPFEHALEMAQRQEFGEILLKGVFKTETEFVEEQLTDDEFWHGILRDRKKEIQNIAALNVPTYLQRTQELVVEFLLDTISRLSPDKFVEIFESYFRAVPEWQQLLNTVSQTSHTDGFPY